MTTTAEHEHTCLSGPVCSTWIDDMSYAPSSPHGISEQEGCEHDSCWSIIFGRCVPCQIADMADLAASLQKIMDDNKIAHEGYCPDHLGARLSFVAVYGAPGVGQHWQCEQGCDWTKIGADFCRPENGPYELSIGDVI